MQPAAVNNFKDSKQTESFKKISLGLGRSDLRESLLGNAKGVEEAKANAENTEDKHRQSVVWFKATLARYSTDAETVQFLKSLDPKDLKFYLVNPVNSNIYKYNDRHNTSQADLENLCGLEYMVVRNWLEATKYLCDNQLIPGEEEKNRNSNFDKALKLVSEVFIANSSQISLSIIKYFVITHCEKINVVDFLFNLMEKQNKIAMEIFKDIKDCFSKENKTKLLIKIIRRCDFSLNGNHTNDTLPFVRVLMARGHAIDLFSSTKTQRSVIQAAVSKGTPCIKFLIDALHPAYEKAAVESAYKEAIDTNNYAVRDYLIKSFNAILMAVEKKPDDAKSEKCLVM